MIEKKKKKFKREERRKNDEKGEEKLNIKCTEWKEFIGEDIYHQMRIQSIQWNTQFDLKFLIIVLSTISNTVDGNSSSIKPSFTLFNSPHGFFPLFESMTIFMNREKLKQMNIYLHWVNNYVWVNRLDLEIV